MVQYWVKINHSPATIKNYFTFVKAYLRRQGIKTNDGDIKDYVKFPKRIKENRSPLTKDLIRAILSVSHKKYMALFLCLSSSGMRISEMLECRVSWLDFRFLKEYGLVLVTIPAVFVDKGHFSEGTKGRAERFTFFTMEAYLAIKPYLDTKLTPTSKLFDITYDAVEEYIQSIRRKLDLNEKYATGFYKVNIHSFRAFTETKLTDHTNPEFSHFLLGQTGYLSQYYRKSEEESVLLYKKAEKELTIGNISTA